MSWRKFALICLLFNTLSLQAQTVKLGMAGQLANDSLLYEAGFRYIGTSVGNLISPSLSDSAFSNRLNALKGLRCEVYMCNVLFPSQIKIAGPEVEEDVVLRYLEKVLTRAKVAGVKNLILGSGGARRLPEQYDTAKAMSDFVVLCKKMALLAERYNVRIILENLNSGETNFINKLSSAASVVRSVGHENFRLNADLYHMMREGESPDAIRKAGNLIVYCEIAEREKRSLPGVMKDDFKPYLKALSEIDFKGVIMIEGNSDNLNRDVPVAYRYLMSQIEETFNSK